MPKLHIPFVMLHILGPRIQTRTETPLLQDDWMIFISISFLFIEKKNVENTFVSESVTQLEINCIL